MSSLDPNDGLTDAELLAGGKKYSGAGLPMGFVMGSDGIVYKQVDGKLVVASPEEARAAAAAERAATAGSGIAPANKQVTTDERTGEAIVVDPRTGAITRTGQQIGFAGVDPRQTAAAAEQRAAADRALTARGQAIDLLKQSQNTLQRAAEGVEAAKVDRAKLKSNEAISNAQLKEQARQADLRAAVDQYNTALNLIPALGQLSIEESKRVQDVLSNGSDFLARAFESRGGTSPLAKVLQADQIGAVSGALSTLRSMISDAIAQSPMAKGGGFDPVQQTQIDAYQPADLTQASSTGMPGGGPGVAPVNDPGTYQFTPAPEIQPVAAPAAAAAGGGFAGAMQGAMSLPQPDVPAASQFGFMDEAPFAFEGEGGTGPGLREVQLQRVVDETPGAEIRTLQNGTGVFTPWEQQNKLNAAKQAAGDATIGAAKAAARPFQWLYEQTPAYKRSQGVPGYAEGTGAGFTRAHMMMVGDSKTGHPTGHEEVIVNPTGAPIGVVPNEDIGGFAAADMQRFGVGTGIKDAIQKALRAAAGVPGRIHDKVLDSAYQEAVRDENSLQSRGGREQYPSDRYGRGVSYFGVLPGESEAYRRGREETARANERRRVSGITDPGNGYIDPSTGQAAGRGAGVEYMGEPQFYPPYADGGIPYDRIEAVLRDTLPRYSEGTGFTGAMMKRYATGTGFTPILQPTAVGQMAPNTTPDPTNLASYGPTPAGYKLAPWAWDPMSVRSAGTPFIKIGGASDPNARAGFAGVPRQAAPSGPTQAELVALSQANLPPAARAVMNGTAVPARTALASTVDPSKYLRPMTARQLNSLDGQELKALGTATNVEFNAPLDYVTGQTARQYGASQQRRSGFVGAMGL